MHTVTDIGLGRDGEGGRGREGHVLSIISLVICRYIHEVLQMYDGGDSSESGADTDSSWDDPEHKNLFDRL